jgi:signal transduction histidine kinase
VQRIQRRARCGWVAACLALLLSGATGHCGAASSEPTDAHAVIHISQATFSRGAEADDTLGNLQPQELRSFPDFWRAHRPGDVGFGNYQAQFALSSSPTLPWAVYVSYANSAISLRVNGVELLREPAFDAAHVSARASTPHLALIPAALLVKGINTLTVRVRAERDINAGLSALMVGPHASVWTLHGSQKLWRVDVPRALNMAALASALFMALLWLRRPDETVYLWFCALSLVWASRALYLTGDTLWLAPVQWLLPVGGNDLFVVASLSLGFALLYGLVNRFAKRPQRHAERLALALCCSLPLVAGPLGTQVLEPLQPAWYGLAVVLAALCAATATRLGWQQRQWGYVLILVGVLFALAVCVHEWLVVSAHMAYTPFPWFSYGPPVLLACVVLALGNRYFAAFDESAQLNRELIQRVQDKTLAIEQQYEKSAQLERVALLAAERERLMRDMHDGVGSRLITLLHALEKGRLDSNQASEHVRECVQDLRLVIDSLDTDFQCMADALANLRFRMEPQLLCAGIASTWTIDETPVPMPAGAVLQVMRILQEALTNALKHAHATQLHISWAVDTQTGQATLQVHDNGSGMPTTHAAASDAITGRGLANMRLRARQLNGQLLWASEPMRGTLVTLQLPFPGS